MMYSVRIASLIVAGFVGLVPSLLQAQQPAANKAVALEWLDRFAKYQVLFHAEDIKKLRDRVDKMSPEEVAEWWEKTADKRELLDSPEWAETESWLRKWLNVQAKYSDEEIRQLQRSAAKDASKSAESLRDVLERIMAARRKLVQNAQLSEETRKLQLATGAAYRQEEVRQREAAWRRSLESPMGGANVPVLKQPRGRYNEPLIHSLDAARWAILDGIYPAW